MRWIAATAVAAAIMGCVLYGGRPQSLLPIDPAPEIYIKPGGMTEVLLDEDPCSIAYAIDGLKPNDFYELSFRINLSSVAVQSQDQPIVRLTISRAQDYNGEAVAGELSRSAYLGSKEKYCVVRRVAKADDKGCIRFQIEIGTKENQAAGWASIKSVACVPADAEHGYRLLQSGDASVRFLLRGEACEGMDLCAVTALLDALSEIRIRMGELTGVAQPYPDSTDYVAVHELDYYGLAGDPIYIHSNRAVSDMQQGKTAQKEQWGTVLWPYIHEMSHTFDGISSSALDGRWNFDREFFADLKMVLVLNEIGWVTREGDVRAQDRFAVMDTLPNGMYSSEGFVYSLVTALEVCDSRSFEHMAAVFRMFGKMESAPQTDWERYRMFMRLLGEEMDADPRMLFPPRVYETLDAHFQ